MILHLHPSSYTECTSELHVNCVWNAKYIWPDPVSSGSQDQDAENKQHGEPNLPDHRGVTLHFIQQATQQIPFAHFSRQLSCFLFKEINTK